MSQYQEITRQFGDQWIAAIKRAEEMVTSVSRSAQGALPTYEIPPFPVPDQVAKFNEALAQNLPAPAEVLVANFELAERLLAAQKELALTLITVAGSEAAKRATTA